MICPDCNLPMSIIGIGGDENNGMVFVCDGPNSETNRQGCGCEDYVSDILDDIRDSINKENVSVSELALLQSLAEYIDPGDVELLEWAGVPEFPEFIGDSEPSLWENDEVQFARLIAEMEACGVFENLSNWHGLFESTDLDADLIHEIIERAQKSFERTCVNLP